MKQFKLISIGKPIPNEKFIRLVQKQLAKKAFAVSKLSGGDTAHKVHRVF